MVKNIFLLLSGFLNNPARLYNKYAEKFSDNLVEYVFTDDNFYIKSLSNLSDVENEYQYDLIESVFEKNNFFIIKIKNIGILAFNQNEITDGTVKDMRKLLEANMGKNKFL